MLLLIAILAFSFFLSEPSHALELPPLKPTINDFAGMFPPASLDDLALRMDRLSGLLCLVIVTRTGVRS